MSRTQHGLRSHSTASSSSSSKDGPGADDYKGIELDTLTPSSRSSEDSVTGRQLNANSEAAHLLANPPPGSDSTLLPITTPEHPAKEPPVTWRSLPRKDQLIILTLARLAEPLTQTSLQAYMYYQLQSFDPSLSSSTISSQAGILQGAFTFAQFLTAIMWGRIADSEWAGRKTVLLVGLVGTAVSAVGFGFSKSFGAAVFWRSLGGALNGNVGVMRTMISEIIREKKYVNSESLFVVVAGVDSGLCRYQSRAFLLLPMTFNIGVIVVSLYTASNPLFRSLLHLPTCDDTSGEIQGSFQGRRGHHNQL